MARPSKYEPSYCDEIVEFCEEGASLASFAAHIDVCRDTISEWAAVHPDFSVAVKRAKAKIAAWYDTQARNVAKNGGGNATLCIFGLKNFNGEDFRDQQDVHHSGGVKVTEIVLRGVSPDDHSDD